MTFVPLCPQPALFLLYLGSPHTVLGDHLPACGGSWYVPNQQPVHSFFLEGTRSLHPEQNQKDRSKCRENGDCVTPGTIYTHLDKFSVLHKRQNMDGSTYKSTIISLSTARSTGGLQSPPPLMSEASQLFLTKCCEQQLL